MADAEIVYRKNGELSTLVGKDAVELARVRTIIMGIKINIRTGGKMMLTRGASITRLLEMAGKYTGKKYKRTEKEKAVADLEVWFREMRDALPQRTEA